MTDKEDHGATSTGLEEHVAGLLCYIATFVTGIIFLLMEKKSEFVRFHAAQSTILFLSLFILNLFVQMIPVFGAFFSSVCGIGALTFWIVLMIKAYEKEYFPLPIIGKIAAEVAKVRR